MNIYEAYNPVPNALHVEEPGTFIADTLIQAMRESNALEFMPPEQRLALIWELCKVETYCLDEASECPAMLSRIRALMVE